MSLTTTFLLALSLSMDSFAAAIGRGLGNARVSIVEAARIGLVFALFQGAAPVLGWIAGLTFASAVQAVDHWIAFGLLALVGSVMIVNGVRNRPADEIAPRASLMTLAALGFATSIDAATVGVTFALIDVDIARTVIVIAAVTFAAAAAGLMLGQVVGRLFGRWAIVAGGVGLIVIGTRVLAEHLGAA